MKRIFFLAALLGGSCIQLSAQTRTTTLIEEVRTVDNSEYINVLSENELDFARRLHEEAKALQPMDLFRDYNLNDRKDGWAGFKGENSGLFTWDEAQTTNGLSFARKLYRLPSLAEMQLVVPLTTKDFVFDFDKSMNVKDHVETISYLGQEVRATSDYYARSKGTIYALRFKTADNKYRCAYRYRLVDGILMIYVKYLGASAGIATAKDLADEKWWNRQTDLVRRSFSVVNSGDAKHPNYQGNYWTSTGKGTQAYGLSIHNTLVQLSLQEKSVPSFVRPYYDVVASVNHAATFFYYGGYGDNLTVNKNNNCDSVFIRKNTPTIVNIYARCNPSKPRLVYTDGDVFPYGEVVSRASGDGVVFEVHIRKNGLPNQRQLHFRLENAEHATEASPLVVTQPGLMLPKPVDRQPVDYIAEYNLATYSGWADDTPHSSGHFVYDDAQEAINMVDSSEWHLPAREELTTILPMSTVYLNTPFSAKYVEEDAALDGEYFPMTSSTYFGRGDGTLYAIRFYGTDVRSAYRYRYEKGKGLRVHILYIGDTRDIASIEEIANDEFFDENENTEEVFFPAVGGDDGAGTGGFGMLWTSTIEHGEAVCYYFDANRITTEKHPLTESLAIRPFNGEPLRVKRKVVGEETSAGEPTKTQMIKRITRTTPIRQRVKRGKGKVKTTHTSAGNKIGSVTFSAE